MNRRSTPEPADEPARTGKEPMADCLRMTETGGLYTRVFLVGEPFDLVDGDGVMHHVTAGETLLLLQVPADHHDFVSRQLDRAELTLHHVYGNRPAKEPTRTAFDIRQKAAGGRNEDVPF